MTGKTASTHASMGEDESLRAGGTLARPQAGLVDCHFHVIGDGRDFPFDADRAYQPPYAPVEDIIAFHESIGVSRGVAVQVSVYGDDNGLLIETLQHFRHRFRGVGVTGPEPTDRDLHALRDAGVVGLRLNLVHGGGPGLSELERYGALCRETGMHLQLYMDGGALPRWAGALSALGATLVFDHFGGISTDLAERQSAVDCLTGLLRDGAWVKLSAPYRVSSRQNGFDDVIALGRSLVEAAPQRCIWGSDWPHVATDRVFTSKSLLDLVEDIAGDAALASAILCDNAKPLYGF